MEKQDLINKLKNYDFNERIVKAFEKVEREKFIPKNLKKFAYIDEALPLIEGATISQPYTIAFMLSLLKLKNKQKILEIGSGSGYVLALISEISKNSKIFGVERIESLAKSSRENLKNQQDIKIICGDGAKGLKKESLFDRILVSAAFDEIPEELIKQLKIGGILVTPVRDAIYKIRRGTLKNEIKEFSGFVFVSVIKS